MDVYFKNTRWLECYRTFHDLLKSPPFVLDVPRTELSNYSSIVNLIVLANTARRRGTCSGNSSPLRKLHVPGETNVDTHGVFIRGGTQISLKTLSRAGSMMMNYHDREKVISFALGGTSAIVSSMETRGTNVGQRWFETTNSVQLLFTNDK